jgi:lysozyme
MRAIVVARSIRWSLGCLGVPLCVVLVGCSGGEPGDGPLGEAQQASVCAAGATVKGVDVSVFQGAIDWPTAKATGLDFAIARISDGTFLDTDFATNWAGMKSAGLVRGAYQFFEPGEDPTTQANIVISAVGKLGAGDLPVTADMEVTGGQSAATIVAHLQTWVAAVQAGTGKAPMIYTALGYWDGSVSSTAFGNLPLWAANWGVTCPSLATGWSDWKIWQYSDSGSVSGIPATVDLDEFNGDLAALQAFAGANADWGAQYVTQSWPLASTTVQMTVNQQMPASITLKNIGAKAWDANTKLATTQPRDRTSPFRGPDWLAGNRLAAAAATAPGADFQFTFTFQAPNTPGAYDEFYGVVQEGTAWFSDPGELGPPDDDIELKVQVNEAQYHGAFVSQTFPTLQQAAITMTTGQTMTGAITIKNVGTATWKAGVTKLAPTPRDKPSAIGSTGWLSPTRVSSPPADVATGGSFDFPLEITAGAPGDYTQTFSLVEESVTWFADAPLGGGPPDDLIAIHVIVTSADGGSGSGGATGAGGSSPDGGTGASGTSSSGETTGAGASSPDGGTTISPGTKSGCSCRVAGDDGGDRGAAGAWAAIAAACLLGARRRTSSAARARALSAAPRRPGTAATT